MVYQSSNGRAMSKSIQTTNKQVQPHQSHQDETNKRMLSSFGPTKANASASASHHSRMTYENVKSQCRRESQTNQKYRSDSSSGHQLMASGTKCRNDHKSDSYQQDQSNDNRLSSDQRHNANGVPMTDIYDDDDLAEVINTFANIQNKTRKMRHFFAVECR